MTLATILAHAIASWSATEGISSFRRPRQQLRGWASPGAARPRGLGPEVWLMSVGGMLRLVAVWHVHGSTLEMGEGRKHDSIL